jgi:hypothetical protein
MYLSNQQGVNISKDSINYVKCLQKHVETVVESESAMVSFLAYTDNRVR